MGNDFAIEVENKNDSPIVRIKGEIDIYSCPKLNQALNELVESGKKSFILNLDNVQYIDSTGLGSIAHAARNISDDQGNILVICNKPQIKKIFEISGLDKKNIQLFQSEESALEKINE